MKLTIVITLAAGLVWLECAAQKVKKAAYEFPAAMSDAVKAEFIKQCDKGQVLYNLSCGKCHMVTINGKQLIPDFTPEQLIGYELRVLNPKHESDIPESAVSAEELGQIMTFLSYKKKNPAPGK